MTAAPKNVAKSNTTPTTESGTIGSLKSSKFWSAQTVTESFFQDIEKKKDLNAYITLCQDAARRSAEESDERRKRGWAKSLDGVPISVKDNFCTKDVRTTAGSNILSNFVPTYESFVSQRVRDAGAVVLGKTNMDEFGMGSSTENSAFGPTLNPTKTNDGRTVVPGGSSGGAAAAVAANLCIAALATDTGGSIRQPAAFCGVVGYKPSYGLCSRWGMIAYASSFDQAGVITKTTLDAAMLADIIIGKDERDSTSLELVGPKLAEHLDVSSRKLKIGIPKELMDAGGNDELARLWDEAIRLCKDAGHSIHISSIPSLKYALPAYYVLVLCEASSNLARYDGVRFGYRDPEAKTILDLYELSRTKGFSPETRKRIILGNYALSAGFYDQYYMKAARVRGKLASEFKAALDEVDVFMWPTAPTSAFEFGSHNSDPVSMYLEDVFTVPINLVGAPAISIPVVRCKNGLPMGIQLIGGRMQDHVVLEVANSIEKSASFG